MTQLAFISLSAKQEKHNSEQKTSDCLEKKKSLEMEGSSQNSRHHDSRRKSMLYVENWSLISWSFKTSSAIFNFQLFNALLRMRGGFSDLLGI